MASIWQNDGTKWTLLNPQGYPDEKTLHELVEEAPQMLPLSGEPRVLIVGKEVVLSGNYADLLGVEPTGRMVLIEIKLSKNAEARRAVVAQILTYAASLAELDRSYIETSLIRGYLAAKGVTSIAEAVAAEDQTGEFHPDRFNEQVDQNLRDGSFRLVLVLDEAPTELVRLVGYLEAVTEKLTIDLITVSTFDVHGSRIVVPRRVDPEYDRRILGSSSGNTPNSPPPGPIAVDGTETFVDSINNAPIETQAKLAWIADWAQSLVDDGLARCSTTIGKSRWILNVRLMDEQRGLVSIYNEKGPYVTFYRSVFEQRAPHSVAAVEEAIAPRKLGSGNTTPVITDDLLDAIKEAYREAKHGVIDMVAT
jgi:hypothetical protein